VGLDLSEGTLEDLRSEFELSLGGKGSLVGGDEFHELVVFSGEDVRHLGSGLIKVESSGGKGSRGTESGDDSLSVYFKNINYKKTQNYCL
jgi:hypothetical protein